MKDKQEFNFDDDSVAQAYDNMLVPILFEPWAVRLIEDHQPWEGRRVLDLATGTGIVAQQLAKRVGPGGRVFAVDINGEMLKLAAQRCSGQTPAVTFVESPAHPLEIDSDLVDFVVCQQGFQFFPDRGAAAEEIFRVMCVGGQTVVTTWCPVAECEFFGAVCSALEAIGETGISDMMRVPFDLMPESELRTHFEAAGFANVKLRQLEQELVVAGGMAQAIQITYATPIGPKLQELSNEQQDQFKKTLSNLLKDLSTDGVTMGRMVSNVLSAEKPPGQS